MKHMNLTLKKTLVPLALVASLAATQVAGLNLGFAVNEGYSITASAEAAADLGTVVVNQETTLDLSGVTSGSTVYLTDASVEAMAFNTQKTDVSITTNDKITLTIASAGNYKIWNNAAIPAVIATVKAEAACAASDLSINDDSKTIQLGKDDKEAVIKIDGTSKAGFEQGNLRIKNASGTEVTNSTTPAKSIETVGGVVTIKLTWTEAPTADADFTVEYNGTAIGNGTEGANKVTVKKYTAASTETQKATIAGKDLKIKDKSDKWNEEVGVFETDITYYTNTHSVVFTYDKDKLTAPTADNFFVSKKSTAKEEGSPISLNSDVHSTVAVDLTTAGEVKVNLKVPGGTAKTTAYLFYGDKKIANIVYTPTVKLNDATITDGELTYNGFSETLDLAPSYKVGGKTYKVTKIGSLSDRVRNVTIQNGITEIAEGAFKPLTWGGEGYTGKAEDVAGTIYIPDSVTTIAPGAFGSQVTVNCSDTVAKKMEDDNFVERNDAINAAQDADNADLELAGTVATNVKSGTVTTAVPGDKPTIETLGNKAFTVRTKPADVTTKWVAYNAGTTKAAGDKVAKVGTTDVVFGNTTAFNKAVDICEVSADKANTVYKIARVYVKPIQPGDLKVGNKTPTGWGGSAGAYTVSVEEGKTVKIPLALEKGNDKTLVYDIAEADNENKGKVSISKGVVKGIKAGTAEITVKSAANPGEEATINVTVTAKAATKLVPNTGSVTLEKAGAAQEFYLSTNTLTGALKPDTGAAKDITVKLKDKADAAFYEYNLTDDPTKGWTGFNAEGASTGNAFQISTGGVQKIRVRALPEITAKYAKKANNIEFYDGSTKLASVSIKVVEPDKKMYAMISGFKATSSKKSIDIPVGTIYKMNMAVNPATADNRFDWTYKKAATGDAKFEWMPTFANNADVNLVNAGLTDGQKTALKDFANDHKTECELGESTVDISSESGKVLMIESSGGAGTPADTPKIVKMITEYNKAIDADTKDVLTMNGNILEAKKPGKVYIQAQTLIGWGLLSGDGGMQACAKSDVYTVNVYDPTSSIAYPVQNAKYAKEVNDTDSFKLDEYTIQGGFLIKTSETEEDSDHSFKTGEKIAVALPTIADGSEKVEWTCNKPLAVSVEEGEDKYELTPAVTEAYDADSNGTIGDGEGIANAVPATIETLHLCFNSPGTYTITGTTEFTKQKFSFKVLVDAPTVAEYNKAAAETDFAKAYLLSNSSKTALDTTSNDVDMTLVKGTKVTEVFGVEVAPNAGGTISVKSENSNVASVDAKGIITAKTKGTTKITVTITPTKKKDGTVTASAKTVEFNVVVVDGPTTTA